MAAAEGLKDQLDHILTEAAKALNIEKFEINSSTEANYGDGFVGQFYAGDVRNKETGESISVAIKKAPSWGFDYNSIFTNENIFYSLIFPALDDLQRETGVTKPFNNLPKYFCGEMEKKKEYIAMENLKPLGYVMFDKKQYLNEEHLETIFKVYGKFHALSYVLRIKNNEKYKEISKGLTNLMEQVKATIAKPMASAVSAAISALDPKEDKPIVDEIQDITTNFVPTFQQLSQYTGEHACLVHGDCWSNNMLFKYSDSGKLLDIKLIDFQLCQDNTPIHDLSYFFYSGATKKNFDNLDNYLQIYHKSFLDFATELGAKPDEIFSFDVLKKEWKENALYGVILGIYLWQIKLIPKRDITNVMDSNKEQAKSMEDTVKLWEALLENVHKTDEYKERTTTILRHAFEYGIINKEKIVRNKE